MTRPAAKRKTPGTAQVSNTNYCRGSSHTIKLHRIVQDALYNCPVGSSSNQDALSLGLAKIEFENGEKRCSDKRQDD